MAPNVTLIVDDQDTSQIQYHCPVTKQQVKGSYFRNTWTTIGSLSCGLQLESGWFSHVFNGTQARIWVSIPQSSQNYSYSVKIDDGPFIVHTGEGYFESPILEDGMHTIFYAAGDTSLQPALDYLTVTAGPSTPLLGRTVIVDDSEIADYSGNWSTEAPATYVLARGSALYNNTTHWTSGAGDSFSYTFNGNSIAIYGVIPTNNDTLNSTATWAIDGRPPTAISLPIGSSFVKPMTELFFVDALSPSTHTLVFNMTDVAPSHFFGIDFIVYNSSASTVPKGSTSIPTGGSTSKNHTGTIVGAVVGSVAGVVLVALFLFLYQRNRRGNSQQRSTPWNDIRKNKQAQSAGQ
ncbi:hypothetical protein R3P38DRAFT_2869005 [Favolaschia claudopus]|uniref:DUF2341 domain-containing protein n=1 Tax=Favolaschia claudopus TaxID=2862362 RepID=A0AAW0DBJ6_9AGAR